jgi:hypothetical protein
MEMSLVNGLKNVCKSVRNRWIKMKIAIYVSCKIRYENFVDDYLQWKR